MKASGSSAVAAAGPTNFVGCGASFAVVAQPAATSTTMRDAVALMGETTLSRLGTRLNPAASPPLAAKAWQQLDGSTHGSKTDAWERKGVPVGQLSRRPCHGATGMEISLRITAA